MWDLWPPQHLLQQQRSNPAADGPGPSSPWSFLSIRLLPPHGPSSPWSFFLSMVLLSFHGSSSPQVCFSMGWRCCCCLRDAPAPVCVQGVQQEGLWGICGVQKVPWSRGVCVQGVCEDQACGCEVCAHMGVQQGVPGLCKGCAGKGSTRSTWGV